MLAEVVVDWNSSHLIRLGCGKPKHASCDGNVMLS